MKRLIYITLATALPAMTWACTPELPGGKFKVIEGKQYAAAWRTQPETVAIGQHFAVELALCVKDSAKDNALKPDSVRVDAHMPEHRHGMNYKTKIENPAPGRYRAEGLMFHMPGRWEYIFEVRAGSSTEQLTTSVVLK